MYVLQLENGETLTVFNSGDVERALANVEAQTKRKVRSLVFGNAAAFTGDAVRYIVDHEIRVKHEDAPLVKVEGGTGEDVCAVTHMIQCQHCHDWLDPPGGVLG